MSPLIFKTGTFSRGSRRVEGCANPVFDGSVVTVEGFVRCHIKLLDEAAFFVESVCSWALASASLPTPEPYWIKVPKIVLPKGTAWPYGNADFFLCFGTRTIIGARTFRHSSSYDPAKDIIKWQHCAGAATFDEAVANDDRGMQNILTDGRRHWLIDHSRAFANNYRDPAAMKDTEPLFTNTLLALLAAQNQNQRLKSAEQIKKACGIVFSSLTALPYQPFYSENELQAGLQYFLDARLSRLTDLCMNRLNIGTLDLP